MDKQENLHIKIDLRKSAQIAITGLNRALNFNKYALSAKYSFDDYHNFKSTNTVPFIFYHQEKSDMLFLDDKQNYICWIALNGIREIVESFFLFVDDLLITLSLAKKYVTTPPIISDLEEMHRLIKNTPTAFSKKIKELEVNFNLTIPKLYKIHLSYLENIRDCISHNLGFVTSKYFPQHAKGGNAARIEWLELKLYTNDKSQKEKLIKLKGSTQGDVYLKAIKHEKIMPYNAQINIDFNELEMIAFTTFCMISTYTEEANNYLNNLIEQASVTSKNSPPIA